MAINNDNAAATLLLGAILKTGGGEIAEQQPAEIRQILKKDGSAYEGHATQNIWVNGVDQFTPPREHNKVEPFTTGEAYFAAAAKAFKAATSEIWIAGWEVNWDVILLPSTKDKPAERLIDLLFAAAQRGVKVYVMPWAGSSAVPTYVDETKTALERINTRLGKNMVFVRPAKPLADQKALYFSHHQKHVVVDRLIAFVGGIDLTYGRRDDAHYSLIANAQGREALERYNGCVIPMQKVAPAHVLNPADLNYHAMAALDESGAGAQNSVAAELHRVEAADKKLWDTNTHQAPTSFDGMTLDATIQPRMPWQDSHVQIEGPAVADVALNFAVRWNSMGNKPVLALPDEAKTYSPKGNCIVQVLRSAPADMCSKEYKAMTAAQRARYVPNGISGHQQDNIYEAMLNLIDTAQHFIYIENQFFVSEYGDDAGFNRKSDSSPMQKVKASQSWFDNKKPWLSNNAFFWEDVSTHPENRIGHAIANRIGRAILGQKHLPFHVFITLPVHPEGRLNDPVVMTQVHQTMQSLVFGDRSLINRIRRFLKMRELRDAGVKDWGRKGDENYNDIPIEACEPWLTLLNLRNWACLEQDKTRFHVTEQIYVHNKMMIVDDMYAIVGSANINERSMTGHRDSELSVLIMDADTEKHDIRKDGKARPTRKFARTLRQQVWSKIFGLTAGGKRAATQLKDAIDHPASPEMWKAIRQVAATNTDLFENAFIHIPRSLELTDSSSPPRQLTASIWPTRDEKSMPFCPDFWKSRTDLASTSDLKGIKGFITLLPMRWTEGENNEFSYDPALYSFRSDHDPFFEQTSAKPVMRSDAVSEQKRENT